MHRPRNRTNHFIQLVLPQRRPHRPVQGQSQVQRDLALQHYSTLSLGQEL